MKRGNPTDHPGGGAPQPAADARERVGRYELGAIVGAGGMGVVYRAWDSSLQRTVALKLLRAGPGPIAPEWQERFLREGRVAAFQDVPRNVERLAIIAEAVGFAHGNRIVHCDLKPANILLDASGNPLVGDFGLAKDLTDAERGAGSAAAKLTQSGDVIGTPGYLSPEQASGSEPAPAPRTANLAQSRPFL